MGFCKPLESLDLIKTVADKENVSIDLAKLCEVWCNGSIIESRLMRDAVKALDMIMGKKSMEGKIAGGETGGWAQKITHTLS